METQKQALQKARHYCAYQERCHSEVKERLYEMGLNKKEAEELLATLIEENYLNEERFAIHFAGGKFRAKQWGRIKIKSALKNRQMSEYCIHKALASIEEEDYQHTLLQLFNAKLHTLKSERNIFIKKRKLCDYLYGKGFELPLIHELIRTHF